MASLGGEGFLATVLGWLVGFGVAALFGALAYLYYEVSVLIAMSAIGFTLGTTAMVALGVRWSWLIVLVGVIAGALLAMLGIPGRRTAGSLRASWAESGGRQMRAS